MQIQSSGKAGLVLLAGLPLLVALPGVALHATRSLGTGTAMALLLGVAAAALPLAGALFGARRMNTIYASAAVEASIHDSLSGLPNRGAFTNAVSSALAAVRPAASGAGFR